MNTELAITLAGCTYRQFDHWARRGYLGSNLQTPNGSGNPRTLNHDDATRLFLLATLVNKLHLTPPEAAHLADAASRLPAETTVYTYTLGAAATPTPAITLTINLQAFRDAATNRTTQPAPAPPPPAAPDPKP